MSSNSINQASGTVSVEDTLTADMLTLEEHRISDFEVGYSTAWDTLYIREHDVKPAVSLPVKDAWVRYDPESLQVLGVDIEDFESVFLAANPGLKAFWHQSKPYYANGQGRTPGDAILLRGVFRRLGMLHRRRRSKTALRAVPSKAAYQR